MHGGLAKTARREAPRRPPVRNEGNGWGRAGGGSGGGKHPNRRRPPAPPRPGPVLPGPRRLPLGVLRLQEQSRMRPLLRLGMQVEAGAGDRRPALLGGRDGPRLDEVSVGLPRQRTIGEPSVVPIPACAVHCSSASSGRSPWWTRNGSAGFTRLLPNSPPGFAGCFVSVRVLAAVAAGDRSKPWPPSRRAEDCHHKVGLHFVTHIAHELADRVDAGRKWRASQPCRG